MSDYKRIECRLVDKDALLSALKELGLIPKVYENPQSLSGFEGTLREQKAEIIVGKHQLNKAFTGASNDLGFAFDEQKGEFVMFCSDYDKACMIDQRVKQAYAKVVIEKALKSQGFKTKVTLKDDIGLTSRTRTKINMRSKKVI